ncbi:MAG TPA: hypothetical protein VIT43_01955 [Candidatus Dormibacteraeota bacterium]
MTVNRLPKQARAKTMPPNIGIDLHWLPLGAGGNFVRLNGWVYEAVAARLEHRPVLELYHSAVEVFLPDGCYVIEQTPVINNDGPVRGVVAEGPVGARWAGRWRIFRYEVRRWRNGWIPDVKEAVDSPRRLTNDLGHARRLLEMVPLVPILVWGRDQARTGEMWNSNSVIAWLLESSGLDVDRVKPPSGGRAPGWNAGIVMARRQSRVSHPAIADSH